MSDETINNQSVNNKKTSEKIAVLILILIFSCGIMLTIAAPLYKELKMTELEIEIEEKNKEERERLLLRINNFKKRSETIGEDDLVKIDRLLINRNNQEEYLTRIAYLAQISGVVASNFLISDSLPKIKIVSESQKEFDKLQAQEAEIGFSVKGDFPSFLNFLKAVENMSPLVDEQSLTIKVQRKETKEEVVENEEGEEKNIASNDILDCQLKFKFYYLE